MTVGPLELTGPDAAARARRAVRDALCAPQVPGPLADLEYSAALVVTELVTNAMLHGAPPVSVRVVTGDGSVRVTVRDGSPVVPMVGIAGAEAMTGRGLAVVTQLACRWGVDRHEGGKTVWAELTLDSTGEDATVVIDPDLDALLAAWSDDWPSDAEERITVRLGDVPTDLLLAAKAHVDDLVREFALASTGAASGQAARVPPRLAELLSSVANRFAEARLAIKRQAVAAPPAGQERTSLVLDLPLSALAAAEDYRAALDEVDRYARASRLLTVETPPAHRVFRHWYLDVVIEALRAASSGRPLPPAQSFQAYLVGEVAALAGAYRVSDRAARLQRVTAALAGTTTAEQVADVVVSEGVAALGASGGSLVVPIDGRHLGVPGAVSYSDRLLAQLAEEPLDAPLPAAQALRTATPVWLESPQERDVRFPALVGFEPDTVAMCAVPLVTATGPRGALRFSFDTARLFDEDERRFVLALAAETAQAMERSDLYAAERAARDTAERTVRQIAVLQELTAALAGATTTDEVTDVIVERAREALGAAAASLSLLEDAHTLRLTGLRGAEHTSKARYETFPVEADLPASRVVRTGEPIVTPNTAALLAEFPELAEHNLPDQAFVCLPLTVQKQHIGALSLAFDRTGPLPASDLDLIATVAQQCATAVQRVWLMDAERAARDRSTFLAEASGLLASSLEPAETLQHLVTLLVPRFADWALTYLVDEETGEPRATAVRHRDPETSAHLAAALPRLRPGRDAPGGVSEVLRTRRSVLYPTVPDEVRARVGAGSAVDNQALVPHTGMAVPLVLTGEVIGVLALARTEGDPYDEADLLLVEDFAARAAVAVGNARSYARTRDAAVTLQHSLLPQTVPDVPGLSFCWAYRPAGTGTSVGGDWYDVLEIGPGRVGLIIGDVMGRGVQAAAVMGQLRATARAHATSRLPPGEVLERLDAMLAGLAHTHIATALYGVLDVATRRLVVASAGHLPPLVMAPAYDNRFLDVEPGPPLGTLARAGYPLTTVDLPPNATLLLYTDGLVEDHAMPVEDGMRLLCESLRATAPAAVCEEALRALGRDKSHEDDTAVLAVTLL